MSLSAQHYKDQHRGRKGRQKPPSETGKQHGVAGSRAPIFGLRLEGCEVKRCVQNLQKKRLGMSLSAQHYQDQHRGRKGRQKPPSETATQHGVAGSRAPIFGLRLECCDVKRRVQKLQKKGLE